ncbi:MAG: glycosyltransferase family 4 protein, partial [Terriglobales bacterium]
MRIAMIVRSFSQNGGLELYAHQLIKGLIDRGHDLTVVCEKNESPIQHKRLHIAKFYPAPDGTGKAAKLTYYLEASTARVAQEGTFDIIHSQHLPTRAANVVTFHNHTAARLAQVGYEWEQKLTRAKMAFVSAYKLRDQYDRELCRSASSLIFPSAVCRDDFAQTYDVQSLNPRCNLTVAYPGASLGAVV